MPARLLIENCVPACCVMFWLTPALGLVETFPVPPPVPDATQVPLASKQVPEPKVPVPNSLGGTNPVIKSAFVVSPRSTYCLGVACSGAEGFPGRVIGPDMVPPAVGKKIPDPIFVTD